MPVSPAYKPAPIHDALGADFCDPVSSAAFPEHRLRYRNERWARRTGLETLDDAEWVDHFGRFRPLPGNFERPLALRYHGHQFRSYNPDLGDGRGFLFAQLRDVEDGRLLDLATKGSGQTPWSRSGDGRLTLKGGVREVLATAQLEALGVYTSKSFSLIETGEALTRGDEPSPTRSSVLVRLGHSHIRLGTFQRQAYLEQGENLRKLVDHSIAHYFPALDTDVLPIDGARTASFLHEVVLANARLTASWIAAGFVHGVLNTDNLNITGESFDYGPYRFLPTLDPNFTAAYFDHGGLYAYGRQPEAVAWNLSRFAECLLELEEKDALVRALEAFNPAFERANVERTLMRLGIRPRKVTSKSEPAASATPLDAARFVNAVYTFLQESQVGFDQFFFDWHGGTSSEDRARRSPAAEHYAADRFDPVRKGLADYEARNPDALEHPYFQRESPCTLLIDEIETVWDAIADNDDWSVFDAKLAEIESMRDALT